MPKPLDPDSREWFLERIYCTRLWEEWTKFPESKRLRTALAESFEKLGLVKGADPSRVTHSAARKDIRGGGDRQAG